MALVVLSQDDEEHPIPDSLRTIFTQIASAFAAGDFELVRHAIAGVDPVSAQTASSIRDNVTAYGDVVAALDPATWERSSYRWAGSRWQALVDLTTSCEPVSDLTLHADINLDPEVRVTVRSVHVP